MGTVGGGSLVCSHAICAGVNGSTGASSSVDISLEDDGERARVERGGVSSATAGDLRRCAGAPRLGIVRGAGGVWPRESSHGSLAGVVSAARGV